MPIERKIMGDTPPYIIKQPTSQETAFDLTHGKLEKAISRLNAETHEPGSTFFGLKVSISRNPNPTKSEIKIVVTGSKKTDGSGRNPKEQKVYFLSENLHTTSGNLYLYTERGTTSEMNMYIKDDPFIILNTIAQYFKRKTQRGAQRAA